MNRVDGLRDVDRLSPHLCAETLLSQLRSGQTMLVRLVISQCAVISAEKKLEGKGFLALTKLLAAEDVEKLHGLQQLTGALLNDLTNLFSRGGIIDDQRDVLVQGREGGQNRCRELLLQRQC